VTDCESARQLAGKGEKSTAISLDEAKKWPLHMIDLPRSVKEKETKEKKPDRGEEAHQRKRAWERRIEQRARFRRSTSTKRQSKRTGSIRGKENNQRRSKNTAKKENN